MDALHHFKARQVLENEDIAADFIENELGPYDWMKNWPIYKAKPRYQERLARWLANAGYTATPAEIEHQVDRMILTQPGRYRR